MTDISPEVKIRFLRHVVDVERESALQERENRILLCQTLARVAPEALAEIKGQLHPFTGERDKMMSQVASLREAIMRLMFHLHYFDENGQEICMVCEANVTNENHDKNCPVGYAKRLLNVEE
jgi:hypothetical protein